MRAIIIFISLLYFSPTFAKELLFFSGSGDDRFLGCIGCSEFSTGSVCNRFGSYGSKFSAKSMFNRYSRFGDKYSMDSPWNKFSRSTSVPVLVDRNGNFYGYFTINVNRSNAVEFKSAMKRWYDEADGDLEEVRVKLCDALD